MSPAEFLNIVAAASTAAEVAVPSARVYSALTRGQSAEAFLTFHTSAGKFEAAPYASIQLIEGDDRGGTSIVLILPKMRATITGRQLGPVFEAIRNRMAAHLFTFDGGRHDPPAPGQPIITEFVFAMPAVQPKAA